MVLSQELDQDDVRERVARGVQQPRSMSTSVGRQVADEHLQLTAIGKLIGAYRLRLPGSDTKAFETKRSTFYELQTCGCERKYLARSQPDNDRARPYFVNNEMCAITTISK